MEEGVGESGARLGLSEESTEVDSNFGSGKIQLIPELEESSISQDPLKIKEADVGIETPILTPEKLVNSQEMDNEAKYSEDKVCLDHHESSSSLVITQVSMECHSFMESDDYSAADNVSEISTSAKNYSTVDDEGAAPQFEDKEILRKESDDVVMELAERLSQLRSIGKTAESARKYILESDRSTEDLDSNDHMSELLGPKRLDFEVIDFDQFGAQPPDLPLKGISTKMHHHGGVTSSFHSGKVKAKKPESHASARHGFDQEMKGLHDSPVKKSTPEKKHLRREHTEGGKGHDVSDTHAISGRTGSSKPRLLDSGKPKKLSEAASGSPIRRSKSTMPDLKGSPVHEETRRCTEAHKRLEEYCNRVDLSTTQLNEQSRMQGEVSRKLERERGERLKSEAKLKMLCELLPSVEENLKSLCAQILVMEAQLQEQVGLRNKLEEALERERQVVKLEDQVDLRSKLEQEREERMHLAVKLEEQVDKLLEQEREERMHLAVKQEDQMNKLEGSLEEVLQERAHFVAKLEEQVDLRNKLEGSLEEVLQERAHFVAKLEEQVDLRNKLEGSLERSLQERMQFVAKLEEQSKDLEQEREERMHLAAKQEDQVNKLEGSLEQVLQERAHFVAKLEEQVDLRSKLEGSLERSLQERMQFVAKLEEQSKDLEQEREERMHLAAKQEDQVNKLEGSFECSLQERMQFVAKLEKQSKDLEQERQERIAQLGDLRNRLEREQYEEQIRELACKLEQERDERLTGLVALREMGEKLVDFNNQVESLTSQVKQQTQLREELQIKLDQGFEELAHKFEEGIRNDISLKDLQDQVLVLATQLQEQMELRKKLEERLERMPNAVAMENRATSESLSIEEKGVFAKMLDEQKELLANQAKEAEMLKSATEKKVGLLKHQVQNLEVLSEIVETMENVRSLKERATRQTMWTIFQAVCLVMGLMSFVISCRNPLLISLHPT